MNRFLKRLYSPDGAEGGGSGTGNTTMTSAGGGNGDGTQTQTKVNADGSQNGNSNGAFNGPKWMAELPAELKESKSLSRFKDVADVAKAYTESEKALGSRVPIPDEKATPEERSAFFKRLGRPDTADKYDVSATKIPAGIPIDQDFQKSSLVKMHELGLSQTQVAGIYEHYMGNAVGKFQSDAEAKAKVRSEGEASLKKEFGNDYDSNLKAAFSAAKHFGGEALLKWADDTGIGNDPNFIRLFVNISKALGEDVASGKGPNRINQGAVNEALAKIDALKKDPEKIKAMGNSQHPKHKEVLAEWKSLHAAAYPGKQAVGE